MKHAMDHFPGILAFVRAAEARSFTTAARKLGISPSGVSKAISRLEAQFNVRLDQKTIETIESLKQELGVSQADIIRLAVRKLEKSESHNRDKRIHKGESRDD